MTIGIYKINFSNGAFYIGRSINIEGRFKDHQSSMRRGKSNYKINAVVAEYGMPIGYDILEECTGQTLLDREMHYIKLYSAITEGLNVSPGGDDVLIGELASPSKYSNYEIERVFSYIVLNPEIRLKEIAQITGVSYGIVKMISSGRVHTWLELVYPLEYTEMILNIGSRISSAGRTCQYPDIKSPKGIIYSVTNATYFANEHDLDSGTLRKVLRGKAKSHKGWTLA